MSTENWNMQLKRPDRESRYSPESSHSCSTEYCQSRNEYRSVKLSDSSVGPWSRPCIDEVPPDCIEEMEDVARASMRRYFVRLTKIAFCHAFVDADRPGHMNPQPFSVVCQIAKMYDFSPVAVDVATSYFRRLVTSNMTMLQKALSSQHFSDIAKTMEELPFGQSHKPLIAVWHAKFLKEEVWLALVFMSCLCLAAKVVETLPYRQLLKTIMSHMYGREMHSKLALVLELEVLDALDWRVGPIYRKVDRD